MIKGVGIDAVKIERIAHFFKIDQFISSVFTQNEIQNEHGNRAEYYATRFACKEAVYKALGIPIDFRTIETLNRKDGSPYVVMKEEYNASNIFISITVEDGLALAYCIVES